MIYNYNADFLWLDDDIDEHACEEIFDSIRMLGQRFHHQDFIRLFVGVFNLFQHRKNPMIEEANLTIGEMNIIQRDFTNAMVNISWDRPINFFVEDYFMREVLSGLRIFRIELLPSMLQFIKSKEKLNLLSNAPLTVCLHEATVERWIRSRIRNNYLCELEESQRLVVPNGHLWWYGKAFLDTPQYEADSEYRLED